MRLESAIVLSGALLVPYCLYSQSTPLPQDSRMWRGTVRFDYNRTANFASSGASDERKTSETSCNSLIMAYAEIKACTTSAPQWTTRQYQRSSESNSRWTDRSKPCMKGVTKRTDMYFPESRGSQHKKTTGVLAEDIPVPPPKVLLLVKPDGSYALEAGGKLPFSISTFES